MKCAADFRRIARESLKGKWMIAVLAGIIAWIFGAVSGNGPELNIHYGEAGAQINMEVMGQTFHLNEFIQNPAAEAFLTGSMIYISVLAFVILIAQMILSGIISAGYARFNLNLVDGKEVSADQLFAYFPQWKTMVAAMLLQLLYITLWTLLFIIPGIIAALRYSMTYFILAENPEMRASEAIHRSKEIMDGNKWRFFCLGLSFFGWALLCVFTAGIGNLFLTPYMEAANAAFYRDITASAEEIRLEPAYLSDGL